MTNGDPDDLGQNGSSYSNDASTKPKRPENIFSEAIISDMNESPHHDSVDGVLRRLSSQAVRVLDFGRAEAVALDAPALCTHHLLLGMLQQRACCAAQILGELGFEYDEIRRRIVFITGSQTHEQRAPEDLEFSPRLIHALDLASHEATRRGHKEVGTIHLLVSLLRAREGLVVTVLDTAGLGLEPVGAAIVRAFRADAAQDPVDG
ncbi:MAG: Clp protease N-terminal domain-containing protein [Thermomicrobiales bacterium]